MAIRRISENAMKVVDFKIGNPNFRPTTHICLIHTIDDSPELHKTILPLTGIVIGEKPNGGHCINNCMDISEDIYELLLYALGF